MNKKILGSVYFILLLLCINFLILSNPTFGEGFDLIITDPENDVEDMDTGKVQGYGQIDIIELKSSENLLETQVILELSVKGVITDSDSITYSIDILDGLEGVYYIYYSNGVCMGTNYDEGTNDVLQASGSGTSTLEVRVQKSDLGEITDFDMSGSSMEFSDDFEQLFVDWIPDMDIYDIDPYYDLPIMITEPKPNATASKTKMIEGICEWSLNMESIEIQIDSTRDGEWKTASTSDNWATWEYSWDTTKYLDGKHTIYARGFNGSEYFYDSISVFINQSNAQSPLTTDVPVLKVGLELHYTLTIAELFGGDLLEENYEMTSEMILKVIKKEKIMAEGIEYEVYNIQTITEMNMTISYENEVFTTSSFGQGTQWIRIEDLATVKTYMRSTYSSSGFNETTVIESIYEPPIDSYNFPMSVAETWTSSFTEHTDETFEYEGKEETYSNSYDANVECEVLHFKKIEVPAGTFDTFAIWSKETSGEYYGQGSPFATLMDGYSINYYSPKLGFPVKTENYYDNRELYITMELTSISENGVISDIDSETKSDEIPFYFLLIPIIVVTIIATAIAVRKKRKKESDQIAQGQYSIDTGSQNQAAYLSSTDYSQSSQTQGLPVMQPGIPQQKSSQTIPAQHSYPPPPPPPQIQRVQPTRTQIPAPLQNVTPIMQIKCPKCFKTFTIQPTGNNVQCPFCGVRGRI